MASSSVSTISRMPAFTGAVVSSETLYSMPGGKRFARSAIVLRMLSATSSAFEPGRLERGDDRRGLAVERAVLLVVERAELDARDVLHAHDRAVGVLADDDVAELLRLDEAPLRADRVRELLPGRRGLGADLPGGVDDVLRAERVLDVGHRQPEPRAARPGLSQMRIE